MWCAMTEDKLEETSLGISQRGQNTFCKADGGIRNQYRPLDTKALRQEIKMDSDLLPLSQDPNLGPLTF